MSDDEVKEFKFHLSCDLQLPVRCKIESLQIASSYEGAPRSSHEAVCFEGENVSQLYVECVLTIDGEPLGVPLSSRIISASGQLQWNEWIAFPFKFCDLTANAQLALTIWDDSDPFQEVAIGGCTIPLFTKQRELKRGRYKQKIWDGQVADGGIPSKTPGKIPKSERGQAERFEKLVNKYDRGDIPKVDWMDKLAFKAMDKVCEEESKRKGPRGPFLWVELPSFDFPVVFQELGFHSLSLKSPPGALPRQIVTVEDPEVELTLNPAEYMESRLLRNSSRGRVSTSGKEAKPNSLEKKEIAAVLGKPLTEPLLPQEQELMWRFRYSLTNDKRALTKLLKCVEWSDPQESSEALGLMKEWVGIDMADAIELLSPVFAREEVRAFAVSIVQRADDDELLCYLLQLVQALRYEASDESPLASFLVLRCTATPYLCTFLYWYLLVEWQERSHGQRYASIHQQMSLKLKEREDGEKTYESLLHQKMFTTKLEAMVEELKGIRGGSGKKAEKLKQGLAQQDGVQSLMSQQNPLPLPLNPKVLAVEVLPDKSFVFKSVLNPIKISLKTLSGEESSFIFKKGDDLRQDQLVIQMVHLMDRLLKKENLDLKLTPYSVLATGVDNGFVEFVPSMALASVLEKHKSLVKFLSQFHPDESGPFGLSAECLDTFVKSCAGYCVIMYILGVGDRHLDNLMLCEDGRLFHIDFGFILGRDPKPFPPPMKLCREMVEAMGGQDSLHYAKFKSFACEAYNILRKSSNLILSLFHLMGGANIPDIASDPQKGMLKLQQKFRLDLDDEAAIQFFQSLINDSVSALFPQVVETIHRWAQYWR